MRLCTHMREMDSMREIDSIYHIFSRVSAQRHLKSTGQKTGVGAFTDKPFVCITHTYVNHRIIKKGGGRLLERIQYRHCIYCKVCRPHHHMHTCTHAHVHVYN